MAHNKPTSDQIQITTANTLNEVIDSNGAWVGGSDVPQNPQTTSYTLALTDRGRHIKADANVVIPANSSISFPLGTVITIVNANSSSNISLSINTDTLVKAETALVAPFNIVPNGIATIIKVENTKWIGTGIYP